MKTTTPIVIHIPHTSRIIPSNIRDAIILSDFALENELIKMTDAYTDELFNGSASGHPSVVFPISRLILDPERFLDDSREIMTKCGMGVIYTHTSDGLMLRHPPTPGERISLIERYYHPHHQALEQRVVNSLKAFGRCLIIDGHSFPSTALPYELDQSTDRPDICIGTDDYHTPGWLRNMVYEGFVKLGYTIDINKPFTGTIVPMDYYQKNPAVMSIMIEVNRKLYLDETTGGKSPDFNRVKQHISSVLMGIGVLD